MAEATGRREPPAAHVAARQRVSGHGVTALLAMLGPAIVFPLGLVLLRHHPQFVWLNHPSQFPWELWTIATAGLIATFGGALDWRFHRSGATSVGKKEHDSHVAALVLGGGSLFVLMCIASLTSRRAALLIPIIVIALITSVLICYDEFVFHRKRCGRYETMTHRMLVFGNSIAWLAWMHWCFVRGAAHA